MNEAFLAFRLLRGPRGKLNCDFAKPRGPRDNYNAAYNMSIHITNVAFSVAIYHTFFYKELSLNLRICCARKRHSAVSNIKRINYARVTRISRDAPARFCLRVRVPARVIINIYKSRLSSLPLTRGCREPEIPHRSPRTRRVVFP